MGRVPWKYETRPYSPEHDDQILELMRLSLGESSLSQRTNDLWAWKHLSSPFGCSYVRVTFDTSGTLVGMRAFMPWEFRVGSQRVRAVRAVDTATHPDHQRRGIFSNLTKQVAADVEKDGVHIIFNTPNQYSLPGYVKLGWHKVAVVRPLVKVLNYPRFARGLLVNGVGRSSRQYLPNEFFRREPLPAAALVDLQAGLERLVNKGERLETDSGRFSTSRSVDYLRWRYLEHPTVPYWIVFAGERDDLEGLAIFRTNTRFGLKEVMLCELILGEREDCLVHALLEEIEAFVRADHLIACFQQGTFEKQCLEKKGFHSVPRQGMNLTVRNLGGELPADPHQVSSWGLRLGDLEFF